MNNFINFTLYSSFLIFLFGTYLFISKPNFFNLIVIIVGITSIINHYHNYTDPDYKIEKWPIYRICDWIFVFILLILIFIDNKKNLDFYKFSIVLLFLFIFIIWRNIFNLNKQEINKCHCISHILLLVFLFYIYIYKIN